MFDCWYKFVVQLLDILNRAWTCFKTGIYTCSYQTLRFYTDWLCLNLDCIWIDKDKKEGVRKIESLNMPFLLFLSTIVPWYFMPTVHFDRSLKCLHCSLCSQVSQAMNRKSNSESLIILPQKLLFWSCCYKCVCFVILPASICFVVYFYLCTIYHPGVYTCKGWCNSELNMILNIYTVTPVWL